MKNKTDGKKSIEAVIKKIELENYKPALGLEYLADLCAGKDLTKYYVAYKKELNDWKDTIPWVDMFLILFLVTTYKVDKHRYLKYIKRDIIVTPKNIENLLNLMFPDFQYHCLPEMNKDFLLQFVGLIYPNGRLIPSCHFFFEEAFIILEKELGLPTGEIKTFLDMQIDNNNVDFILPEIKKKPKLRLVK